MRNSKIKTYAKLYTNFLTISKKYKISSTRLIELIDDGKILVDDFLINEESVMNWKKNNGRKKKENRTYIFTVERDEQKRLILTTNDYNILYRKQGTELIDYGNGVKSFEIRKIKILWK